MKKYIVMILMLFLYNQVYVENSIAQTNGVIIKDKAFGNNIIFKISDNNGEPITYTDSHDNKATRDDYINVENNYEKYLLGLNYGKYNEVTDYAGSYQPFLYSSDSFTLDEAKLIIAFATSELEKQSQANAIYDIFEMGYKYDSSDKFNQFSCSDSFINDQVYNKTTYTDWMDSIYENNYYAWRNRALKKATDIIRQIALKKGELTNNDKFFLILAEYVSAGLYNLQQLQKDMQELIDNGITEQDIYSYLLPYGICDLNENKCKAISKLMYELPNLKTDNVLEAFNDLKSNNLLEYTSFLNGYFNFYNDGFYDTVQVSKVNEYSVLTIFDSSQVNSVYYSAIYPRFYKVLYGDNKKGDSLKYKPLHCTDNVYFGNIYIFPYNQVTYIINTTIYENKVIKIEVRSPKLFNTSYDRHYSIEPLIRATNRSEFEKNLIFHRVSAMGTFSYNDNIIYNRFINRKPFADFIGDIERMKDIRGEKILPNKMQELFNVSNFNNKDYDKSIKNYITYLQEYTKQQLIYDELYFYNIKSEENHNIILAAAYFYNNQGIKKEALFIVDNKNLQIINEELTKKADVFVSSEEFRGILVYQFADNTFVGYVRSDNNLFLISMKKNQLQGEVYPLYNYDYTGEKIIDKISSFGDISDDLVKLAKVDCLSTNNKTICSNRPTLTAKAYAELLYKKKMEKAEKNYYPENIKKNLREMYKNMNDSSLACGEDSFCVLDVFIRYAAMFEY